MKSFFLVFWLGHLIGDFVFQTNKIAYLKSQSKHGLLIHVGLVWLAQMIIMSSYGYSGLWAATICSFVHYFVDVLKIELTKKGYKETYLFLFDQSLHASVLFMLTLVFGNAAPLMSLDMHYVSIAAVFLAAGYAGSVFMIIALRDFDKDRKNEGFFKPNERIVDMVFILTMLAIHMVEKPLILRVIVFISGVCMYAFAQRKVNDYNTKTIVFKTSIATMILFYAMAVYRLFN